jgi:hypothetical protein
VRIVRTPEKFLLHFNQEEKLIWAEVLKLYPRIPSAHQPLSKAGQLPEAQANQQLLDEALQEQRNQNKKQLQELQADPRRWAPTKAGLRLSLSRADVEWLLQVLNDIRVGNWILLGSPEDMAPALDQDTYPVYEAMEMCFIFQLGLLKALGEE